MKIVLLPDAVRDLDAIEEPMLGRIYKRLELLRRFPEMGTALIGPFSAYRSSVVGLFRIKYRVTGGAIEVASCRHCRRDPSA